MRIRRPGYATIRVISSTLEGAHNSRSVAVAYIPSIEADLALLKDLLKIYERAKTT